MVDVQLLEITDHAWGSQNKQPWNKEPQFCEIARLGMKVDNVVSIASSQESKRLRRLMGGPFARKFILDQQEIFKRGAKKLLENINQLRLKQNDKVNILLEYKRYAFGILSNSFDRTLLTF